MAYKNKISGIYIITCNDKHYIGRSVNCMERISKHKSLLRKGEHHNSYLQNYWNKYSENFTFDIIDSYRVDTLPSMENWWCNLLNTHDRRFGFNIDPTSPNGRICTSVETIEKIRKSNSGKIVSIETKEKLRIINTGKKISEITIDKLRNSSMCEMVDSYDKYGNFLKTYRSMREAERETGVYAKSIKMCIDGKYNVTKSFIFKMHGDILSNSELLKRNNDSFESNKVSVIGYYLDGTKIGEFDSYYKASKFTNLDPYKISLCCRGIQKRVKNTYWLAI